MQQILLFIHVLVAIGVVVLVLLQQGRGADAGAAFGGGASGSMFGSRGATTFLTRVTTVLVTIFFITSLSLAWLSGQRVERRSVIERVELIEEDPGAPGQASGTGPASTENPGAPAAPAGTPDAPPAPEAPGD